MRGTLFCLIQWVQSSLGTAAVSEPQQVTAQLSSPHGAVISGRGWPGGQLHSALGKHPAALQLPEGPYPLCPSRWDGARLRGGSGCAESS